MTFVQDNTAFEAWLRRECERECKVVEPDLEEKHERMEESPFVFLRATFFRWAKRIEKLCPQPNDVPRVLSVGDAHTENFGTWRDAEGRLVWGINDFDEAAIIPYPFDLVRLATSARLAPNVKVANGDAAKAILKGYGDGLAHAGPALLDESESWMREYVASTKKQRRNFWKKVKDYPDATPPARVAAALRSRLPEDASVVRFASRTAGGGGLGRPRFVVIAEWCGGWIVREAKALVPSAWDWAHRIEGKPRFLDLAQGRFRAPDPHLALKHRFIVRRIAPDARKIDLEDLVGAELKLDLLEAMGFDIGAIHAATRGASEKIIADLEKRDENWLHVAAKAAADAVHEDYEAWCEFRKAERSDQARS